MTATFTVDDFIRGSIGADIANYARRSLEAPTGVERLANLEALDGILARERAKLADTRAAVIAAHVRDTSTRQAAADLGLSPSAVAKAVARVRALT